MASGATSVTGFSGVNDSWEKTIREATGGGFSIFSSPAASPSNPPGENKQPFRDANIERCTGEWTKERRMWRGQVGDGTVFRKIRSHSDERDYDKGGKMCFLFG